MAYGDKQARQEIISSLPGVEAMRKMAGFQIANKKNLKKKRKQMPVKNLKMWNILKPFVN